MAFPFRQELPSAELQDLTAGVWSNEGPPIPGNAAELVAGFDVSGSGWKFFRVSTINPGSSVSIFGDPDTDGDGQTDASEFLAGTNPFNPNSIFKISRSTFGGSAVL